MFGKIILLIALILFIAYLISLGFTNIPFAEGMSKITSHPYPLAVLLDLYLGQLAFAFFIVWNEDKVSTAVLWIAPILLLGNILPVIYLIKNYSSLKIKLDV